ncbi:hypothetical protein PR048_011436 [Dryococelus australis]|uniref:Integrase catalytic domain-containing protein n=1 Tax=Dryococelus australis TaxID=614101 RepID=A0ABQ9HLJ4_9NEOP|nr:hypothetical protein PR048_011436 [Dryococelus australis]
MQSTMEEKITEKLQTAFAANGLPEMLVVDNGPQFRLEEFGQFCKTNAITLLLIPPFHQQSNGAAERTMKSVKTALLKHALVNGLTGGTISLKHMIDKWLFAYCNTPPTHDYREDPSRNVFEKETTYKVVVGEAKPTRISRQREQTKKASRCPIQSPGSCVGQKCLRRQHRWLPGCIVEVVSPVTYRVKLGEVTIFCHQDHLHKSHLQEKVPWRSLVSSGEAGTGLAPERPAVEAASGVRVASAPDWPATGAASVPKHLVTVAAPLAPEQLVTEQPKSQAAGKIWATADIGDDSEGEEGFHGFGGEATVSPDLKLKGAVEG